MSQNQTDRLSKLQLYSLGIVVEDKARNSDIIQVYPVEQLPMIDGKVSDFKPKYKATLPDAKGTLKSSKVEAAAVIEAKWIPYSHSNRMTSPDVIKNETVLIFRFADTEEYYWTTVFREPSIRRKETVVYAYGNKSAPLDTWDKNSSYWLAVSTHDKYMHLHSSKSDGEPFEYDIKVDTRNGSVEVKDDVGNFFKLDSRPGKITATAKKDIELNAPTVTINCQRLVNNASSSVKNNTPVVNNSGNVNTAGNQNIGGSSWANPHYNSVH